MAAKVQTTLKIDRLPVVKDRTGMGRSTIYKKIALGEFPAPIALGARSVGWDAAEVDAWIAERLKNGGRERVGRVVGKSRKSAAV